MSANTPKGAPSLSGATESSETSLSIVVIGLNEETHLRTCFQSIEKSKAHCPVPIMEVLYVDSGSTDDSISIGYSWADRVFQINEGASAASGRQVGLTEAVGDIILFLDGDMELHPNFLAEAIPRLHQSSDEIVGVVGIRDDIYYSQGKKVGEEENIYRTLHEETTNRIGGALLARRDVIQVVGGYLPAQKTNEEPDLHARLRAQGHRILAIPIPFIRHHTPRPSPIHNRIFELLKPPGHLFDFGEMVVRSLKNGYFEGWVRLYPLTLTTWMSVPVTLLLILFGTWRAAIGLQLLILGVTWSKSRLKDYPLNLLRLYGFFISLLWPIKVDSDPTVEYICVNTGATYTMSGMPSRTNNRSGKPT